VGLDDWSPGAQPGLDRGDLRVLPGSWADPLVYMPWADTPEDLRRQAIRRQRCCLPLIPRRWLLDAVSRGWLPRPAHSLSTLRGADYSYHHARLASGGWL